MKGDFSRDTFDPAKHFSRVLMQQGRVQLDADWNEQVSILLHHLRALAEDLIGPHGGPRDHCGFAVYAATPPAAGGMPPHYAERLRRIAGSKLDLKRNVVLGPGHYYVDGILCENDNYWLFAAPGIGSLAQPAMPYRGLLPVGMSFLLVLHVREQHITSLEDDSIREVALGTGGPDTATRAKVVWHVQEHEVVPGRLAGVTCENIETNAVWVELINRLRPANGGRLKAKAAEAKDADVKNPCAIPPEARYRGAENHLYRVEIHKGGTAAGGATFKWSRENGSVVFPVVSASGAQVTLGNLGRDATLGLQVGDIVEVVEDWLVSNQMPGPLMQVAAVDPLEMRVTLRSLGPGDEIDLSSALERHPVLRRWEQKVGGPLKLDADGAARIVESNTADRDWLHLEDGIHIQFQPGGTYTTGDYWLIPARTQTGDVEWPGPVGEPEARPPHGVERHFAPLALVRVESDGTVKLLADYRRKFRPAAKCDPCPAVYLTRTEKDIYRHEITAHLFGGDPAISPTYTWSTNKGRLTGTGATVTLDLTGLAAGDVATVKCEVGGAPAECPKSELTASLNVTLKSA